MDQAIKYKTTLNQVNQTITNYEKIGLNMTNFINIRNSIVTSLEEEVKKSYSYSGNTAISQEMVLNQIYISTISKLESLSINLEKYEIYHKTSSITKLLALFLSKETKTEEEFTKIRNIILPTLNSLINSNTLDYNVEKTIIEDIYEMTYSFIKEEISFFGYSLILNQLVSNETHSLYLSPYVKTMCFIRN